MVKAEPSINLLSKTGAFSERFLAWALSAGRIVVIATEVVALLAFLYRFSLDRQLIDLHSKIRQEQTVLAFLKDNEDTFRNLQNRLALAAEFGKQGKEEIKIMQDIVGLASSLVVFNNIGIAQNKIKIDANGNSVNEVANFVKKLKNYPQVSSVSIDKIENRSSSASINVSITAVFKEL